MPPPLEADVLVIGGGLAGARAAQAATDAGAKTLLVSKTPVGAGGASARASGGFAAAVGAADSAELHAGDTRAGGCGINAVRLVETITARAPDALARLHQQVGGFAAPPDALEGRPAPLHTMPRSVQYPHGMSHLMGLLGSALVRAGTKLLTHHRLVDLVRSTNGQVSGAWLFDQTAGALVRCEARAVVLATGGCGQLFPVTSNGPDATGDGYAAALRAGCALQDMEFIQFTPTAFAVPTALKGHTIVGTLLTLPGVKLLNAKGERFMKHYAPELGEGADRATLARAIYREVREGRGTAADGVYLDATTLSADSFNQHRPGFYDLCKAHGLDPCTTPLQTAPAVHTCLGGIQAGPELQAVPGLFVAGEVMAGMHGGNRLSSNSLTEANVTGWLAGEQAAASARRRKRGQMDPPGAVPGFPGSGAVCMSDLHQRLQELMAAAAGVERDAGRLRAGLNGLALLRHDHAAAETDDIGGWLDLRNMLLVAEAILGSALQRTESRGAHVRTDHPARCDEHWLVNVSCVLEDDALAFQRGPLG